MNGRNPKINNIDYKLITFNQNQYDYVIDVINVIKKLNIKKRRDYMGLVRFYVIWIFAKYIDHINNALIYSDIDVIDF